MLYYIKADKFLLENREQHKRARIMPDGDYFLEEFPVEMKDGIARTETGSLAGSTLQLLDSVMSLKNWTGDPLYKVWHRGSLSPAQSLGKADKLGSIKAGKLADYVVLDCNMNVKAAAIEGVIKYQKEVDYLKGE